MDIGSDAANTGLSAGSIKIMWDTGAGIDSAIFATAAEVQTALRTITGWEAVTVELWASRKASAADADLKVLESHQFKVTFAAGYDDLGKSPTFYTMLNTDGAYATAVPTTARARLYDQRFSNSIWLGKVTGMVECTDAATADPPVSCTLTQTEIDGSARSVVALPSNGDKWVTSNVAFGTGGGAADTTDPGSDAGAEIMLQKDADDDAGTQVMTNTINADDLITTKTTKNYAYLKEGKFSVQTSDYFAVGSTIEVLGTTWSSGYICADTAGVEGT